MLSAAAAVGGPYSAQLIRRYGSRRVAVAGLLLTSAGLIVIAAVPARAGYAAGPLPGLPSAAWASA